MVPIYLKTCLIICRRVINIRDNIRLKLNEIYGGFETKLESDYSEFLIDKINVENTDEKHKWLTYNQVILEIKHGLKNMLLVKELQYRLTDNSNPNEVCLKLIEKINNKTPEIERLYYKILNFKKEK
jgi:hypothetical protein